MPHFVRRRRRRTLYFLQIPRYFPQTQKKPLAPSPAEAAKCCQSLPKWVRHLRRGQMKNVPACRSPPQESCRPPYESASGFPPAVRLLRPKPLRCLLPQRLQFRFPRCFPNLMEPYRHFPPSAPCHHFPPSVPCRYFPPSVPCRYFPPPRRSPVPAPVPVPA